MEHVTDWKLALLTLPFDLLIAWVLIRVGLKVNDVPVCLRQALRNLWAWLLRRVR